MVQLGSVQRVTARNRIRRTKIQREAEGYLEIGMSRQALDVLSRLGEAEGFDAHTFYLRGEALRMLERYAEAIAPLLRAAEAVPDDVHIWLALGWCYKRSGQIELAIEALQRALSVEPAEESLLHYNLACYCCLAGHKQRALDHLAQALAIDPGYRQLIDTEPDFNALRHDADFQAVCEGAKAKGSK